MKILLATDGSKSAKIAEALTGSIGWPAGSEIDVLHVDQLADDEIEMPARRFAAAHSLLRGEIDEQLTAVCQQLSGDGRTVRARVVFGRPATVIVDEARELGCDLIVIGSRGNGVIASAVLGSVAAEVVDHAACPVLVARRPSVTGLLLADDGSESSGHAVDVVTSLPFPSGLPIRVVSVASLGLPWYAVDTGSLPAFSAELFDEIREAERNEHGQIVFAATKRLADRGLVATQEVREGPVAEAIVDAATSFGADLIVMGSRGRTGLARLLLGSVARRVLYGAKCSVLIVRGAAEATTAERVAAGATVRR